MKILQMLDQYSLCLVDLEVDMGGEKRHAPTLCAVSNNQVIPLNTPDGRPILMNHDNAIMRVAQKEE